MAVTSVPSGIVGEDRELSAKSGDFDCGELAGIFMKQPRSGGSSMLLGMQRYDTL